jgi:hypothetical protein
MTDEIIESAKQVYLKTKKTGFILTSIYDNLLATGEIDAIEDQDDDLLYHVESRMQFEAAQKGTRALMELAKDKGSKNYQQILTAEIKKHIVARYFELQNQIDNF